MKAMAVTIKGHWNTPITLIIAGPPALELINGFIQAARSKARGYG